MGYSDNLFPNAYSLLNANKAFLLSESVAYLNKEVVDSVKCQRDIGYMIDGVAFDVALGTTYNAYFLGIAQANSLDLSNTVFRTITRAKLAVAALTGVAADSTAVSRSNAFFVEVNDISQNGITAATTPTYTNPTDATAVNIAAKDKIIANRDFLRNEIIAWTNLNYASYDTTQANGVSAGSCDVRYAIEAVVYDILNGGNSGSYNLAKLFTNSAASLAVVLSGTHQTQVVAAYRHLQTVITKVVKGETVTASSGNTTTQVTSGTNATTTEAVLCSGFIDIFADVLESGATSLDAITKTLPAVTWASATIQTAHAAINTNKTAIVAAVCWVSTYTYNQAKCERDLGYILTSYLYDLRYGGNSKTITYAKKYWDGETAQVDGNRVPEIDTHAFIGDLITDYVLPEITYAKLGLVAQVTDATKVYEGSTATTRIDELVSIVVNTITTGLTAIPTFVDTGVGYVKFIGNYDSSDILLVTNTSANEVIYTFNETLKGGFTETFRGYVGTSGEQFYADEDFKKYLQVTDAVTKLQLNFSTATALSTDELQIFIDTDELIVRPYEFGTDAIERMRIAPPVSMLDADFEYGLQPTKWSAIATMRGYPSVYEIPGTETDTTLVRTDSSAGTGGVGASLITITTVGAHGFIAGDAITVKGLNQSVVGVARAEGAFILTEVPSQTTFTYYAKAKVGDGGTIDIQVESTQLRKAGFYTGASIGESPNVVVQSNGSSGTIQPALTVPIGEDVIPFNVTVGAAPEIGSPMTGAGISTGTQVTGKVGTGGIIVTPVMTADTAQGATEIVVQSVTGIAAGQGANRGDGQAMIVNSISGLTVTFNDAITKEFKGNYVQYNNVGATNIVSLGQGLILGISRSGGSYTVDDIFISGTNYQVGDQLQVLGDALGGESPANDASFNVTNVDTGGEVLALAVTGAAFAGTGTFNSPAATYLHGNGAGGIWDVTFAGNAYSGALVEPTFTSVTGTTSGGAGTGAQWNLTATNNSYSAVIDVNEVGVTGYAVYDVIKIAGTNLGGSSPLNDAEITITAANSVGYPTSYSVTGTAANAQNAYTNPAFTTGSSGVGAQLNINADGTVYSATIQNIGSGYAENNTLTIAGTALGGTSPANDCTITINTVDTGGEILTQTATGTAVDSTLYANISSGQNLTGAGATFNVAVSGVAYSVTLVGAGDEFAPNQTITIPGTSLGGATPTNDIVLTVTDVDNDSTLTVGPLLTFSAAGTALRGTSGYVVNDRLQIVGNQFTGGVFGTNDMIILVTSIGAGGYITGTTITGTAPDATASYTGVAATGGSGSAATFDVTRTGATYSIVLNGVGTNYVANETLTILGTNLGGATTANDATVTITAVDGSGAITTATVSGAANNAGAQAGATSSPLLGSGATFNVALASQAYTVSVGGGGSGFVANQKFTIVGNLLAGATPANDATITVTAVSGTGAITAVSSSGTGTSGDASFTGVVVNSAALSGNGANFNILRDGTSADSSIGTYTISGGNPGNGYAVGNRLLIGGGSLGGSPTVHDITISVASIDSSGSVVTYTALGDAYAGDDLALYSTITIDAAVTAQLALLANITFEALATMRITFDSPHGLVPGDTFITTVSSDNNSNNHNLAAGSFLAIAIPTKSSLDYTARAVGAIVTDATNIVNATVYPRPDSFFIHRPYDGGVQLGTGGPQHGAQAIRQSKKYIRYQSGKGIMYTTGALFAPSYDLRSCTSSGLETGSTITVTCDDNDHGLQIGGIVNIIGITTAGYNSTYTVNDIIDERTFEVTANLRLGATTATLSFNAQVSTKQWHGATVRSGVFDDQNGIYWEYDGTNLLVNQRTSTKQTAGTATIAPDTNVVTGLNTRFQDQLKTGDRIVIRGMTHVVSHVNSQTEINVTPDYRGVNTALGAKVCLVSDKKVRQADFNLDRMDGTGPSGYALEISKMQMIGIEYSWYGAGFIDFMVRGADGNFVYAHRMRNSNINTEAFMRSGNLPVRYEVTNEGAMGKLRTAVAIADTTLNLDDVDFFPNAGTLFINNELITYTGRTESNNTLTGCTRAAGLTNFQAGAARTYTAGPAAVHAASVGVVLVSNTTTPLISHWGSAFITDGGFDEDRGYIFSYAEQAITVSTTRQTAFMIRLAPSVSNAIVGDLGERELLNRAQLLLTGLEITSETSTGGIVVEGVLNPQNYPTNPSLVNWTGLSGLAQGGQPSFAQIASGAGITWSTGAAATETTLNALTPITAVLDSGIYNTGNNSQYLYINAVDFRATFGTYETESVIGVPVTGTNIQSNTTVQDAYIASSGSYGYFRLSRRTSGSISANSSNHVTLTKGGAVSNTNSALVSAASWEASGGANGTAISGNTTNPTFPSGTLVNNIVSLNFAGTAYYELTFNNAMVGTFPGGSGTIILQFVQPPFAQPGETVLSFIATPNERASLDLTSLKELTNTTLGGRGTFPNGPDVLAINIYKTAGSDVLTNIILRWGEAQA